MDGSASGPTGGCLEGRHCRIQCCYKCYCVAAGVGGPGLRTGREHRRAAQPRELLPKRNDVIERNDFVCYFAPGGQQLATPENAPFDLVVLPLSLPY